MNTSASFFHTLDSYFLSSNSFEDLDQPTYSSRVSIDPMHHVSDDFINANLKSFISLNGRDPFNSPDESEDISNIATPYETYTKLSKQPSNNSTDVSDRGSILKFSKKIKKDDASSQSIRSNQPKTLVSGTGQNIIKNYIKAISSFANSDLAASYLIPMLDSTNLTHEQFVSFICTHKESVDSLKGLISLTRADSSDGAIRSQCKSIFKKLCVVFLDYFAVNWIYSSTRLRHRQILMKNRFVIKRKIQNPSAKVRVIRPNCKSISDRF